MRPMGNMETADLKIRLTEEERQILRGEHGTVSVESRG